MTTLELSREDVLDLIGILVTAETSSEVYFKEHEPLVSRARELGHDIAKQLVGQETVFADELHRASNKFTVRGLNL